MQEARSWWKKFTTVLKTDLNFEQYKYDSCLLKRQNESAKVFLIVYVDHCFVVGDKKAVKLALDDIEKHFSIIRSDNIEDFIGCRIEEKGKNIWLSDRKLEGTIPSMYVTYVLLGVWYLSMVSFYARIMARIYIVGSAIHGNMGFGHDNLTHNYDSCLLCLS